MQRAQPFFIAGANGPAPDTYPLSRPRLIAPSGQAGLWLARWHRVSRVTLDGSRLKAKTGHSRQQQAARRVSTGRCRRGGLQVHTSPLLRPTHCYNTHDRGPDRREQRNRRELCAAEEEASSPVTHCRVAAALQRGRQCCSCLCWPRNVVSALYTRKFHTQALTGISVRTEGRACHARSGWVHGVHRAVRGPTAPSADSTKQRCLVQAVPTPERRLIARCARGMKRYKRGRVETHPEMVG